MKKAIVLGVLTLLFCVFCACQRGGDNPPADSSGIITTAESREPEPTRTRVPVVTSTLPPLPETTTEPEITPAPDDSIFRPETFEEQDGTLGLGSDEPGYGGIGR